MIKFHSPRLVAAFGGIPLERLTKEDIEAAVARGGLREEEDLDFKRRLTFDNDGAKWKFATDVAAFANSRGGAVLVGVSEHDGAADAVEGVPLDEDFPARLFGAVATWMAPVAEFGIHFAASTADPKLGVYIITIPRSASAPHAVRSQQARQAWAYPRRVATNAIYLSESEVADAYRSRLNVARDQLERVRVIFDSGTQRLAADLGWICFAVAPSAAGRINLDRPTLDRVGTRAVRAEGIPPMRGLFDGHSPRSVSTRAGRVTLSEGTNQGGQEESVYAELYADGSGYVAVPLFARENNAQRVAVPVVGSVRMVYAAVTMLVDHAVGTVGAAGDALCAFKMFRGASTRGPMVMVFNWMGFNEAVRGSRPLNETPLSFRTLSMTACYESARERLAATHMLMADAFTEFGIPEGRYLTPDGTIRLPVWGLDAPNRELLLHWATNNGVPTSEADVEP